MFMRWRVKTHSFFYILLAGDEIVVLTTISVKAFVAALPAFLVGYRKRVRKFIIIFAAVTNIFANY